MKQVHFCVNISSNIIQIIHLNFSNTLLKIADSNKAAFTQIL